MRGGLGGGRFGGRDGAVGGWGGPMIVVRWLLSYI